MDYMGFADLTKLNNHESDHESEYESESESESKSESEFENDFLPFLIQHNYFPTKKLKKVKID